MFKHLLVPTDGSAASEQAIRRALGIARENRARVIGLHVMAPFLRFGLTRVGATRRTRADYEEDAMARARKFLLPIESGANEAGLAAQTRLVFATRPYEAIVETAQDFGCDLVVMASHGWRGMQAVLLGSQTQKVLTHCTIPVLVLR